MTPDGGGGYLCSWSGDGSGCMTFEYTDVPADLWISPAGTFNAPSLPFVEDGEVLRNNCTGFVIDALAGASAPAALLLE